MLRFGYAIAYVPDVEAALAFYERAFGLARRFIAPDGMFGELDSGETALAVAALALGEANFAGGVRANNSNPTPAAFEVALVADDVPRAFVGAIEAGATALAEPKQKPWGQTVAFVRDPFGLVVELCSPM